MKRLLSSVLLLLALSCTGFAAQWTAVIDSVVKNPDGLTLTVAYHVTDGVSTINKVEPLVSPTKDVKRIAQDQADYQNAVVAQKTAQTSTDASKLTGPVDLSPKPPDPPTQAQIDEAKRKVDFAAAWLAYQEIHAGLVDGDEAKALQTAKGLYRTGDLNFSGRGF